MANFKLAVQKRNIGFEIDQSHAAKLESLTNVIGQVSSSIKSRTAKSNPIRWQHLMSTREVPQVILLSLCGDRLCKHVWSSWKFLASNFTNGEYTNTTSERRESPGRSTRETEWQKLKLKVTGVKPSLFQDALLHPKCLLWLLSSLAPQQVACSHPLHMYQYTHYTELRGRQLMSKNCAH